MPGDMLFHISVQYISLLDHNEIKWGEYLANPMLEIKRNQVGNCEAEVIKNIYTKKINMGKH